MVRSKTPRSASSFLIGKPIVNQELLDALLIALAFPFAGSPAAAAVYNEPVLEEEPAFPAPLAQSTPSSIRRRPILRIKDTFDVPKISLREGE